MQVFVQTRRRDIRANNQIPIMKGLLDIRERLAERGTSPTVREGSAVNRSEEMAQSLKQLELDPQVLLRVLAKVVEHLHAFR